MSSLQEFQDELTRVCGYYASWGAQGKPPISTIPGLYESRKRLVTMYREALEKADELDNLKELARKDQEEWQAKQPSYLRDPLEGIHDQ